SLTAFDVLENAPVCTLYNFPFGFVDPFFFSKWYNLTLALSLPCAILLIYDCFLSLSASIFVFMNYFLVIKAFSILSLVLCKFFFFLPLSVTLISFIISLWIVVRTFSVFNSIEPL